MSKDEAIRRAGSIRLLAKMLGISPAAVSQWRELPQARIWQLQVLKPEWFSAEPVGQDSGPTQ